MRYYIFYIIYIIINTLTIILILYNFNILYIKLKSIIIPIFFVN